MARPRGDRTAYHNRVRGTSEVTQSATPSSTGSEFRNRKGEIIKFRPSATNSFEIPEHLQENGWSYQWQAHTVYGEPSEHLVEMLQNHWEFVSPDSDIGRYFNIPGNKSECIVVRGLVLMERDARLTARYKQEARERTEAQYRDMMGKSTDISMPVGFVGGDSWSTKICERETVDLTAEFGIVRHGDIPDEH
jgi:hypothetical protein